MRSWYYGALFALATSCRAWQATYSDPTQCEDMTVSWAGSGGERVGPPFVVRLAAFGLAPLIVNVPTAAWSDTTQSGSYRFSIPWPEGTKFVAVMDDGFDLGTGGVTGIQTVKASSNSSCVPAGITQPERVFDVSGSFIQCAVLSVNWTEPATNSTVISGIVPNGVAFRLDPPALNSTSTKWYLNIPGGTAFALVYTAKDTPGLTSKLFVSQATGGNSDCLPWSPTYPSATASQTGVAEATGGVSSTKSSVKPGPIAGAVLGAIALVAALAALIYFLYWRRRKFSQVPPESPGSGKEMLGMDDHNLPSRHYLPEGALAVPFVVPSGNSAQEPSRKTPSAHSRGAISQQTSRDALMPGEPSQSSSGASSSRQDRSETETVTDDSEPMFIQHADGGSVPEQPPRARQVIELPPNYDQLPRPRPLPRPQRSQQGAMEQIQEQEQEREKTERV